MRKFLEILRDECFVLFRRVFMGDVAGVRLILEQALELIDDIPQSQFSLKSVLACRAEAPLTHRLAGRRDLRGCATGAGAHVMTQPLVLAGETLQPFRQRGRLLAQLIFFLRDLSWSLRGLSLFFRARLVLTLAVSLTLARAFYLRLGGRAGRFRVVLAGHRLALARAAGLSRMPHRRVQARLCPSQLLGL